MSSFLCPYIKEAEKGASLFGEKGDELFQDIMYYHR
jgi:hypothetical protein